MNYRQPFEGDYPITQRYGEKITNAKGHTGIDYACPSWTPILASEAGTVMFAGWDSTGYGNTVIIEHADGNATLYAHLAVVKAFTGEQVKKSPNMALTGAPTAPTPASGDDSTRIATTEWVMDAVSGKADTADLGDLATLDSIDYTSNKLTNKPTLGAMASQSDAPSDSKEYVRKNGAWAELSGGGGGITSVAWGDVTGTIANQTDLANALAGKQNVLTFDSTPTASSTNPVESGGVKTALDAKQDTLTFDTTPTASSTNPVTSGGVKSYVDSHDDFKITGTVSSGGYTLTDSRINDEHWEVDWVQFGTSSNVIAGGSWSTDIVSHTLTLSATYSGSTSVVVNMHWVQ